MSHISSDTTTCARVVSGKYTAPGSGSRGKGTAVVEETALLIVHDYAAAWFRILVTRLQLPVLPWNLIANGVRAPALMIFHEDREDAVE